MKAIVRVEPVEVRNRLTELELEEKPLRDVVKRGQLAFNTCTSNHPPLIPGIWAWGETVRALREYVLTIGWGRSDDNNYSVVINPTGKVVIAVATGDEGTGLFNASPSTKAPKGPNTTDAVNKNKQLSLFDPVPLEESFDEDTTTATWVLLMYRADNEVRCELSLPSSIGEDGYIDGWLERIILQPIPHDGNMMEIIPPAPPMGPDLTVEVRRRA